MIGEIQGNLSRNYVYTLNNSGKIVDKKEYIPQDYMYILNKDGEVIDKKRICDSIKETALDNKCFKETMNLSMQETPDSINGIPVADLSKRYEFYSTGDPEQDHQIQMGLDYKKSCFDLTHSREFDEITAAQKENGFDGMSRAEKYAAIYEKYQYCYGENFLEADAIEYVSPPMSEDGYLSAVYRFYREVSDACGGASGAAKARKKVLYDGMNDNEIRQAIIDKYTVDGVLTQRNLFKAANEMDLCGVGGGIGNALNPIGNPFIYNDPMGMENSTDRRERMLDTPVTVSYLKDLKYVIKNMSCFGSLYDSDVLGVIGQISANVGDGSIRSELRKYL